MDKINLLINLGRYPDALVLINEALSSNENHELLFYLGAQCYLQIGAIKKAKTYIHEAIQLDLTNNQFKFLLAKIYLYNTELTIGFELLRTITPKNEEETENFYQLSAFLNLFQTDIEQAKHYSLKTLNLNPNNVEASSILSYAELMKGNTQTAKSIVENTLKQSPEHKLANYVYTLVQIRLNKVKESESLMFSNLAKDASSKIYKAGLKFVLLSKNVFSRQLIIFLFFIAKHEKGYNRIQYIFYIITLIVCVFYGVVSNNIVYGYCLGFLIGFTIPALPVKTFPMLQNLFLARSPYRQLLVSKKLWYASLYILIFLTLGVFLCISALNNPALFLPGFLALYICGLPFDYFYTIQSNFKVKFLFGFILINIVFLLLFLRLSTLSLLFLHLIIVFFLIGFAIWKKIASIKTF